MKMKKGRWTFYSAWAVVLAATIAPALYFGHRHEIQAKAIEGAAARLAVIPDFFGPWRLREEEPLPDPALRMLQCDNYVSRTYIHGETGESVSLVALVAPAGPLVAHTPEICMPSREYKSLKPAERISLKGRPQDHFFSALFHAMTLEGRKLNVYYAWSRDGNRWEAPDSPRITLGPLPMLYKIQVASIETSAADEARQPAALTFLADLLPIIADKGPRNALDNGPP